jgi:outer membrane protein insertion porin family
VINFRYCILALLILGGSVSAAQVKFRDLAPADEARLRKELPTLFGTSGPDYATLDQAIRVLMSQGTFENIFVEKRNNGQIEIIGKPLRLIEDIVFTGVSEIDEDDLREVMEIKVGERFDRKKAVTAAEKVKNLYGERGYFNAVVELGFNKAESQNIRLAIDIQEGVACRIKGLHFETSNSDLRSRMLTRFRRILNRPLTIDRGQKLINDIDAFLIDNRYLATEAPPPEAMYNDNKTEAFIQIELREPYRWEFYFLGKTFDTKDPAPPTDGRLTATDLQRALDIGNRERKNVDPAGEGAERLRRAYLAKGFPNIQIDTKVMNPAGTYLKKVYYTINEGKRVKIKKIEVSGRISRNSRYYENFVRKNSSALVAKGFYNRQDLENGFKNLVTDLRNQGFLRARALSSRVEYSEKKDAATIYLLIEEGSQTQIRALDFEGNRFFSNFELAQVTQLETNTPLKLNDFETSLDRIKNFYRNQGFLEMRLLNETEDIIQYNEKGTQARIVFRIFEGPRIRINAIAVEGNSFTKTRVILKEANFKIGEVLTPEKIEEATIRLNKMGLFSRAGVRTLEENSNIAERTLVISVTERDPGVFRFGGGINNERDLTLRGFSGLAYNNLWGTGRAISGRVEVKSNVAEIDFLESEITAGYLEPFLFDTRTRGRVNLTRSQRVFEYSKVNELTPIITINRLDLLAERDLTRHTRLTWKAWSLELREERERRARCLNNNEDAATNPRKFKCTDLQIATLGPSLDIDYSDNRFSPTRGSLTRFILDYSNPSLGSSNGVEFFRADVSHTQYIRLGSPNFVWANSVRGGYLRNLSDEPQSGVPTSYAFLLGGIYTVRGFDSTSDNERIPKNQTDENGRFFGVDRGNKRLIDSNSQYYLLRSEVRFPIYDVHGGVVFYDGAGVRISGYDFDRPYRDAVGVGYRYNTPVGPAAVDAAFKINPDQDRARREKIFRFHLSIGTF